MEVTGFKLLSQNPLEPIASMREGKETTSGGALKSISSRVLLTSLDETCVRPWPMFAPNASILWMLLWLAPYCVTSID